MDGSLRILYIVDLRQIITKLFSKKYEEFFLVLVAVSIGISTAVSIIDFDAFKRCAALTYQHECALDDNIFTAQLNVAVQCNNTNQARLHANYCSRNENVTYCKVAEAYQTDLYKIKFIDCKDTIDSSAECSTTCRNALKNIRNNLGCCINAIYNFTGSEYEYLREGLTYSLWSSCGVEPITSTCRGMLPFTLPNNPQQTCSYGQELTRQLELTCSPSNLDSLRSLLGRTGGCESFMQFIMGVCSLDANGTFCLATSSRGADYTRFIIPLLISNCAGNTQSCSSECKGLLEGFRNNRGCCVNALYNSTFTVATAQNYTTSPLFADQSLFNRCNVEAPPLTCELPSGSLSLKAFTFMLLLPLVVYIMDLF